MAQIYKEQVREKLTPSTPDTSLMSAFDKKRKAGIKKMGDTADAMVKRRTQEEKSMASDLEAKALQVYKDGYDLFNNNPNEYNKFTTEGLKKLYDATPDTDWKNRAMASVAITGSGFDAKVTRRQMDKEEKIAIMREKDATMTSVKIASEGSGSLFAARDNNLSDEQKAQQVEAWKDSQIPKWNAYNKRFDTDRNGNPIYSVSEKAYIKDQWENRGAYAILDYAGENMQTNYEGVVALRNTLIEKQDELKEQLGIDDKSYTKTLSDLDKIISGQITRQDQQNAETAQLVNDANFKEMTIKIDEKGAYVENDKYNNLDSTISMFRQLQRAEGQGAYTSRTDREKVAQQKGKLSQVIIQQVEEEVGFKHKSKTGRFGIVRAENVGERALSHINGYIADLSNSFTYKTMSENDQDVKKANMYISVIGDLKEDESINLKDVDNARAMEIADKRARDEYYLTVDGIVGYNVAKRAFDPTNPASVDSAYKFAFREYDNAQKESYTRVKADEVIRNNYAKIKGGQRANR